MEEEPDDIRSELGGRLTFTGLVIASSAIGYLSSAGVGWLCFGVGLIIASTIHRIARWMETWGD